MEKSPLFLLIEDNLIDQLVIKQLLKKVLDITQVTIANNGEEAIEWLYYNQSYQHSIIIILDIQMPLMNGFAFLNEFDKLNDSFKNKIQIYVVSSTLEPEEIKRINENKYVTNFFSKPLPIEEFKQKIYLKS